jgi:nitrite reductase/ring-hydroxylating ferredoxin subunit
VQVNDYVLAVANLDGQFYAFQEFCTHRYGPLSEGRLHAGQVQCPWHKSCFDVRTGKVTQGPAKVDLRTFPVSVVDGVVRVTIPAEAGVEPGRSQAADGQRPNGARKREPTPT